MKRAIGYDAAPASDRNDNHEAGRETGHGGINQENYHRAFNQENNSSGPESFRAHAYTADGPKPGTDVVSVDAPEPMDVRAARAWRDDSPLTKDMDLSGAQIGSPTKSDAFGSVHWLEDVMRGKDDDTADARSLVIKFPKTEANRFKRQPGAFLRAGGGFGCEVRARHARGRPTWGVGKQMSDRSSAHHEWVTRVRGVGFDTAPNADAAAASRLAAVRPTEEPRSAMTDNLLAAVARIVPGATEALPATLAGMIPRFLVAIQAEPNMDARRMEADLRTAFSTATSSSTSMSAPPLARTLTSPMTISINPDSEAVGCDGIAGIDITTGANADLASASADPSRSCRTALVRAPASALPLDGACAFWRH